MITEETDYKTCITVTTSGRVMTSAIESMTVADVRKALSEMRERWKNNSPKTPYYITDRLSNGMTIEEFSHRQQVGQHKKRHAKCKSARQDSCEAKNIL